MAKYVRPENEAASISSKGELQYTEPKRFWFFGIPSPFTKYLIYDNDICIDAGVLNTRENDCYMYRVTDVQLTRSLWQRMLGLSSIVMYTSDVTDKTIILKNIKHGREIKDFILQASDNAKLKRRTVNMQNIGFDADGDGIDDLHS